MLNQKGKGLNSMIPPSLLCLSPFVLDQSFPREISELRMAQKFLVMFFELLKEKKFKLVFTPLLREFINDVDYYQDAQVGEIYHLLNRLIIQNEYRVILDLDGIDTELRHPLPANCINCGNAEVWMEELGKLLHEHHRVRNGEEFFVGVACEQKFAGLESAGYHPENQLAFPLCGPEESQELSGAYEWVLPPNWSREPVYGRNLENNYKVIGGTTLKKPPGGSHYKLSGKNIVTKEEWARPWPFDKNAIGNGPIPDNFMRSLSNCCSLPRTILDFSLVTGSLPPKRLRLFS